MASRSRTLQINTASTKREDGLPTIAPAYVGHDTRRFNVYYVDPKTGEETVKMVACGTRKGQPKSLPEFLASIGLEVQDVVVEQIVTKK